ncbi:hypothetical protein RIF29_28902 [Crotalaria pallida]|uniref:F-box domain-containing protein n=1 Tax=Crotalaria pallida TaxID=3830 RepID=A0AAN9HZU4_CROPI
MGLKMGKLIPREVETEDMLSDLPDFVLLHIMGFMKTKDAVQTCVLSTRWMHLWKNLTTLKLNSSHFQGIVPFSEFVSSILSYRDGSISLLDVDLRFPGYMNHDILNNFFEYVVSRGIQQLKLDTRLTKLPPCIFSCQSLKFLKISNPSTWDKKFVLPKSLGFPVLESLHIENVCFEVPSAEIMVLIKPSTAKL